jgi:hypothetical protein
MAAVISIRFTEPEKKIVSELTKYFHEDRSKIVKRSILELYEDLVDRKEIEKFEKLEAKGKVRFYSANDVLKLYEKKIAPSTIKAKGRRKTARHFS